MTEYKSTTFFTHDQIIDANKKAGYKFFDKSTMRFWKTRFCGRVYAGKYFVTSEKQFGIGRVYSVRQVEEDGEVYSVYGSKLYGSRREAIAKAKSLGEM